MSAEIILDRAAELADWSTEEALAVALEYIDNQCDTEAFSEFVNAAASEDEADEPDNTVTCKLCGNLARADTAHLHQGEWIGNACCWDERLRSTE